MLKTRVMPTLLHKDWGLVKGVGFDSGRRVGSAMQAVKVYEMRGVDEMVFLDISATPDERPPDSDLVRELADECFMPLTVGGGVRSLDHVAALLTAGADRVSLNTAVVERPSLVREIADRYGVQCVVASIDVTRRSRRPEVVVRSGTAATGLDPVELARQVADDGAGEILLTSVDRDGTMTGYDLELIAAVASSVTVPVIASGGAGSYSDLIAAVQAGASAVAASSMFQFTEQTPAEAKAHLARHGVPVRA